MKMIANIRWSGYVCDRTGNEVREMYEKITPETGDILLSYVNGTLTQIIPGKWSHTGLIIEGKVIGDTLVNGVCYSTAYDFCINSDGFALVRLKGKLTPVQKQGVKDAFKMFEGTSYDFWADYFDKKAMNCTELVRAVYKEAGIYEFELKRYLFRHILLPDDIVKNPDFETIYIKEGKNNVKTLQR